MIKNAIMFAIGACMGSALTICLIKEKYENEIKAICDIAENDINNIREFYENKKKDDCLTDNFKSEYEDIAKLYDESELYESKQASDEAFHNLVKHSLGDNETPEIIKPEEFGALDDYEDLTLIYHRKDGILLDEDGSIVDEPYNIVGTKFVDAFGIYEKDTVYVKNNRLKCYYEIILEDE